MKRRKFIKGSAIVGASLAIPTYAIKASGLISLKSARTIHQILDTDKTRVGTLPILRAFAGDHQDYVSPFVLFDEFGPVAVKAGADPLRVDAHPHAGVIPTSYFIDGSGHHKDSLNFDFQIGKGDFMMFSSGKGAIHMEETGQKLYDDGGLYHGFQIWLNMPSKFKFNDPSTAVHRGEDLGFINNEAFSARIILGELFDVKSKVELLSPAFYYHVNIKENGKVEIPTHTNHNAFVYNIRGTVELTGQRKLTANQIALYNRDGSEIEIYSKQGADLLILGGLPLNERVYSYGPFVMNNEEQIRQCIADYQNGKMGNPDLVN